MGKYYGWIIVASSFWTLLLVLGGHDRSIWPFRRSGL
jgi:hypothetical protein